MANTATVTGTDPNGTDVTATDSTDTPIAAGPAITLDKSAGTPTGNDRRVDTIDYTFMVTNTGNVTLTGVVVDDPKVGTVSLPGHDAGPGCVDDVHGDVHVDPGRCGCGGGGQLRDRDGHGPAGTDVTATDTTSTPIPPAPSIALDKTAGTPTGTTAGSTIDYTFMVTNTGNVTLTGSSIDDPKVGHVTCPVDDVGAGVSRRRARRRTR